MDTFDAQDAAYKESVLPDAVKARVAVEAGVTSLWPKYVGMHGKIIGVDTFGESAPAPTSTRSSASPPRPSPRPSTACSNYRVTRNEGGGCRAHPARLAPRSRDLVTSSLCLGVSP
jgi:hypothetical protein